MVNKYFSLVLFKERIAKIVFWNGNRVTKFEGRLQNVKVVYKTETSVCNRPILTANSGHSAKHTPKTAIHSLPLYPDNFV